MSVFFGQWNFDGAPIDPGYISQVDEILAPYGPEGSHRYSEGGITLLCRSFSTSESSEASRPRLSHAGAAVCFEGRLDNRQEIVNGLGGDFSEGGGDLLLIESGWRRWGQDFFSRLIGDWAVAVWNPADRSMTLAVDFLGSRQLYYRLEARRLTWCTILDAVVLPAENRLTLNHEYLAGLFTSFPATGITPFRGIDSVRPAHLVQVRAGRTTTAEYWRLNPSKRIEYGQDAEYEEHFRCLFEQAVVRRLRSAKPILAELSGGMDSSSIVCVADRIMANGGGKTPRVDTLSYYNDAEPSWDERPYFSKVEEMRGRVGLHIDAAAGDNILAQCDPGPFAATPGGLLCRSKAREELAAAMRAEGYRVVLSGIGGDEFLGGVPDPIPQLSDLLAQARFCSFARQLQAWAMAKRKPVLKLLLECLLGFLPPWLRNRANRQGPGLWLSPEFVSRYRRAILISRPTMRWLGPRPSFQDNVFTLDQLRRLGGASVPSREPLYERRYPYLDRDLVEFLCAIPREQLLRPGQRRSLQRRAMKGIVPSEILHRRRKAYLARAPLAAASAQWCELDGLSSHLISSRLGIVIPERVSAALDRARNGLPVPIIDLMRVFTIDRWLTSLCDHDILRLPLEA
ncbi:MAG TPA: asparagine synthase-related protein, partial [Terriglobales bacterium]